jgi:hypothetical protein
MAAPTVSAVPTPAAPREGELVVVGPVLPHESFYVVYVNNPNLVYCIHQTFGAAVLCRRGRCSNGLRHQHQRRYYR